MGEQSTLVICLTGRPGIWLDGEPVKVPSKALQLLALVAAESEKSVTRARAASILWGDRADQEARGNLRQLLRRVRLALPTNLQLFETDTDEIRAAAAAAASDLARFVAGCSAADEKDIEAALEARRGHLLDGVTDLSIEMTAWIATTEQELDQHYLDASRRHLLGLTRYGTAPLDKLHAIERAILRILPGHEEAYQLLIEAYGRAGHLADVRRVFGDLSNVSKRDYDSEPSGDTIALMRRVFAGTRSSIAGEFTDGGPEKQKRPRVAFLSPRLVGPPGHWALHRAFFDDIVNALSRYRTFTVLAPHSSMQLDHQSGVLADNSTLRADYTISGHAVAADGVMKLHLRLLNCQTYELRWAAEFPFHTRDLLSSFKTLTTSIAGSLAQGLERELFREPGFAGSGAAYGFYLKGLEALTACDLRGVRRARQQFKEAENSATHCAPALARVAQTMYLEWLLLGGSDPKLLSKAQDTVYTAIEQDPDAGLGYWMSGAIAMYRQDFGQSEAHFAHAEALAPNCSELLVQYADALAGIGAPDDAWTKYEAALDLNPLPPDRYLWVGATIAFLKRDFRHCADLCDRVASAESVLRLLTASQALSGDLDAARESGKALADMYPGVGARDMLRILPWKRREDIELYIEGLTRAGIQH